MENSVICVFLMVVCLRNIAHCQGEKNFFFEKLIETSDVNRNLHNLPVLIQHRHSLRSMLDLRSLLANIQSRIRKNENYLVQSSSKTYNGSGFEISSQRVCYRIFNNIVIHNNITCMDVTNDTCSYNASGHDQIYAIYHISLKYLGCLLLMVRLHDFIQVITDILNSGSDCLAMETEPTRSYKKSIFVHAQYYVYITISMLLNESEQHVHSDLIEVCPKHQHQIIPRNLSIHRRKVSPRPKAIKNTYNIRTPRICKVVRCNKFVLKKQNIQTILTYSGGQMKNFKRLFTLGFAEVSFYFTSCNLVTRSKYFMNSLYFYNSIRNSHIFLTKCSNFHNKTLYLSLYNSVVGDSIDTIVAFLSVEKIKIRHCLSRLDLLDQKTNSFMAKETKTIKTRKTYDFRVFTIEGISRNSNEACYYIIFISRCVFAYKLILMIISYLGKICRHKTISKVRKSKRIYRTLKHGSVVYWKSKIYRTLKHGPIVYWKSKIYRTLKHGPIVYWKSKIYRTLKHGSVVCSKTNKNKFLSALYFNTVRKLRQSKHILLSNFFIRELIKYERKFAVLMKLLKRFFTLFFETNSTCLNKRVVLENKGISEKGDEIDYRDSLKYDSFSERSSFKKVDVTEWSHNTLVVYPIYRQSLDSYFQEAISHSSETGSLESMKYEWIRLGTFGHLTDRIAVSALSLAKAGFYFTGISDECRCFSCGISHCNWTEEDEPLNIHRQLSSNCLFINGYESGNIAINATESMIPNQESEGNHSEQEISDDRYTHGIAAQNGFTMPPIQSELTFGPATQSDQQHAEHTSANANRMSHHSIADSLTATVNNNRPTQLQTNIPGLPMRTPHATVAGNNLQVGRNQRDNAHVTRTSVNHTNMDPLGINFDRPKYPAYSVITVRISTFQGWPTHTGQEPKVLAQAGFFYAGYSDFCRCFFCGGGLRNWETVDDPWVEHSRWFPRCAYVLQNKGEAFVALVLQRYAEQNEPTGENNNIAASEVENKSPQNSNPEMDLCVQSVMEMGYSREIIDNAISVLRQRGQNMFEATVLLETVFSLEEQISVNSETEQPTCNENGSHSTRSHLPMTSSTNTTHISDISKQMESVRLDETESLIQENQFLRNQRLCRICREEDAAVAFLPCGHLVCCHDCAPALVKCCVCHEFIRGTVKTWLA